MKISIIIPVYNASKYLRQCIYSILSQSFNDFELILVNDGSIDNSLSICNQFAEKDNRIKVISGPNGGVSMARNKGLALATGEWITFSDADDYFLEDALQTLYDRAMQTGSDLVLANAMKLDNEKLCLLHKFSNEVLPNVICSIKHFALWGYLFKGEIIRKNDMKFVEGLAYSEDRIFIYQIARYCRTIAYCNTPVYVYRINDTSACSNKDGVRKACHQIDASYHLAMQAEEYIATDKKTYAYLRKQSQHIVKLGLYSLAETNISLSNLTRVKYRFFERFGKKPKEVLFFYFNVLKSYFTYRRRKIITFRK